MTLSDIHTDCSEHATIEESGEWICVAKVGEDEGGGEGATLHGQILLVFEFEGAARECVGGKETQVCVDKCLRKLGSGS